jgi:hypothetical protein
MTDPRQLIDEEIDAGNPVVRRKLDDGNFESSRFSTNHWRVLHLWLHGRRSQAGLKPCATDMRGGTTILVLI